MAFETIYENYQITINYFVEELQNEGKQTINGNDSIKINILDMDTMYKYETKINSYEDLDKLPEFMQNLEVISNMICSALKGNNKTVKCFLIKENDKNRKLLSILNKINGSTIIYAKSNGINSKCK